MGRLGRLLVPLIAIAPLGPLAACTAQPTGTHVSKAVVSHVRGIPRSVHIPADQHDPNSTAPVLAWAGSKRLYLVAWGSSSCPVVPGSVKAVGPHWIKIDTVSHDFHAGDDACTADLSATTTTIALASTVDDTTTLLVDLDGRIVRLGPRTH